MNNILRGVVSRDRDGRRKGRAAEANTAHTCTLGRKMMGGGGKWGRIRTSYITTDVHKGFAVAEVGCGREGRLPCGGMFKSRAAVVPRQEKEEGRDDRNG